MWELTLVCDCSRVFNRFSADLDAGFQFSIIWAAPPFSTSFPLAQQIFNRLHLQFQFKFSTGSMVFNWFVGSFNRLNRFSTGCVGSFNRFSTGRQTSCDWLAVEFSRDDGNALPQTKTVIEGAIVKESSPWQLSTHARLLPRSQRAGRWWSSWEGRGRRTSCSPTAT